MKKLFNSTIVLVMLSLVSLSISAKEQRRERVKIEPTGISMTISKANITANMPVEKRMAKAQTRAAASLYPYYYCEGSDWFHDDEGKLDFNMVKWEMIAGTLNGVDVLCDVIPNPFVNDGIDGLAVSYKRNGNKIRIEPQPIMNVAGSLYDLWICNGFAKDGAIEYYVNDEGFLFPDEDNDLNQVSYVAVEKGKTWDYYEEYVLGEFQQTDVELVAVNVPTSANLMWNVNPGGMVHLNVSNAKVNANFEIGSTNNIFIEDEYAGLCVKTDDPWVNDMFEPGTAVTGSMTGLWIVVEGEVMPSLYIDDDDLVSFATPVRADVTMGIATPTVDDLLKIENTNRLVTIANTDETPIVYVDGSLTIWGVIKVMNLFDNDYIGPDIVKSVTGILYIVAEDEIWLLPRSGEDIVADEWNKIEIPTATKGANGPAYNLTGSKVSAGYKGIVIKNGKKMLVR